MKRITFRLAVALLTFLVGIAAVIFWIVMRHVPIQTVKTTPDCMPVYNPEIYVGQGETWGTVVLARFNEMPLKNLPACVDESYRLIWVPTFHSPVVVRIWRSGEKYFLVAKQLDGQGGYGMGNLASDETRPLTENEWVTFINLLQRASYWDMPSVDYARLPNDGASWIIEGSKNKRHHEVRRYAPSKEFRESCVYLLKSSGLKTEYEKY